MMQCYITQYIGFCISSLAGAPCALVFWIKRHVYIHVQHICGAGQMQPDMFSVAAQSRAHFFSIDAKAA